ncbi:Uncharacterised protein [Chlamydia abortus]|nr:Uncharacterised protein [Chlamydia abortus]
MEITKRRLDSTISFFASWLLSIQRCSIRTSFLNSSRVLPAATSRLYNLRLAASSFAAANLFLSARTFKSLICCSNCKKESYALKTTSPKSSVTL